MILNGVQRGGGQNLASHFLKSFENERITLADMRGAVAQDLHGAFKEWHLASRATKCRQYMFALAINPDPNQRDLTHEEYRDLIERIERRLGLEGQPRAIVFHTKDGREHAHVVWSRVTREFKAVQLDYFKDKLMRIAIHFAKEHELALPPGLENYNPNVEFKQAGTELTQADKHAQRTTGLTKEQHEALLTECWKQSDTPQAFRAAIGQRGYVLARGDRRAYVAVDRYGNVHSLARRIQGARTKDVTKRLEAAFPLDKLPSVEEAKSEIRGRDAALSERTREQFNGKADKAQHDLKTAQEARREKLTAEFNDSHAGRPEDYRKAERDRLHRNLEKVEAQERRALDETLTRQKRQQSRSGEDGFSLHASAAALDALRKAVADLERFDKTHPLTAQYVTAIHAAFTELRRLEGRQDYAKKLKAQMRGGFAQVFGAWGPGAQMRFEHLTATYSIRRAVYELARHPSKFGKLPGWQFGRLYLSRERREALARLRIAGDTARKSHFMSLKVEAETEKLQALREKLELLKTMQRRALQAPPEGRLLLQHQIAACGSSLNTDHAGKLTAKEKYHLNQARRLMADREIRAWAEARLAKLGKGEPGLTPQPDLTAFDERIDLGAISTAAQRKQLNEQWRHMKERQQTREGALRKAQQEEYERVMARRLDGLPGRVIGFFARFTGLAEALERHRAKQDRRRKSRNQGEWDSLKAKQKQDIAPLREKYKDLSAREQAREKLRKEARENARSMQTNAQRRADEMKVNGEDITAVRQPPAGDDDRKRKAKHERDRTKDRQPERKRGQQQNPDGSPKRRRGRGFGFRRGS